MNKRFLLMILSLALLLSLTGCGGKSVERLDSAAVRPYTYQNGNQITNIGDPYVFTYDGRYYCTATGNGNSYDLYASDDLVTWEKLTAIFYSSGTDGWVRSSLWQPQIVVGNDGRFYLYYCGNNDNGSLRIGVASADRVTGPYTDVYGEPLMDYGFAQIDPNLFVDEDGSMYLYYSRDCSENVVDGHHVSQIWVVEMADYTHVKEGAEPVLCLTPEQRWELLNNADYQWNEGPDMLKHNGVYYLFYSGGFYGDKSYSLGYATSDSPLGPFVKYAGNPILSSTETVSGPGNNSFFYTLDGKELFNAYHTHTVAAIAGGNRKLAIDRCGWREDGTFYMNGPSSTMQPAPSGESALQKLEGSFSVTASATGSGAPAYLLDGEFSGTPANVSREWRAPDSEKASVTVSFGEERALDCIALYRCYEDTAVPESLRLRFSDGSVIDGISFTADSTEPVLVLFPQKTTDSITVEVSRMGSARRFGLAEIGLYTIGS